MPRVLTLVALLFLLALPGHVELQEAPRAPTAPSSTIEIPTPPPAPETNVEPSWDAVRYTAQVDGRRLVVHLTSTVAVETSTWIPLPLGNLTLLSAQIDGAAALLEVGPRALIPAGRHRLSIAATLPMERTPSGQEARWRVGLAGPLEASGLKTFGGIATGAGVGLAAGSEIRLVSTAGEFAGVGEGTWMADGRGVFRFGRGVVEAEITLELTAFGAAPDRVTLILPAGLSPVEIEGAESEESEALVLRPQSDRSRVTVLAEGRFEGDEFSLAGLRVEGAGRGEMRLEVAAQEGCEALVEMTDGVMAEGTAWRVVKRPYQLLVRTRAVENLAPVQALASVVRMATTLQPDGRRYGQMELKVDGRVPRSMRIELPTDAKLLSVVVGETTVAPSRSGDSLLVSLAGLNEGGWVRVIYERAGAPFRMLGLYEETMPRVDLPLGEISWEAIVPQGTTLLGVIGAWLKADSRWTAMTVVDSLTDILAYLLALPYRLLTTPMALLMLLVGASLAIAVILWQHYVTLKALAEPDKAEEWVKGFTSLIEPSLIVFMGCTVGFIVLGLQMPLFDMGSHVRDGGPIVERVINTALDPYTGAPVTISDKEAPEERAPLPPMRSMIDESRPGGASISVAIPREGTLVHLYRRDLAGGKFSLLLMGKWTWRFLMLGAILAAAVAVFRRPAFIPPLAVGAALGGVMIPGLFLAGCLGMSAAVTLLGSGRFNLKHWR